LSRHDLPPLPIAGDDQVFSEPWQAQAFAMAVALHESGLFSWKEWAEALSAELKSSDAQENGGDYYRSWLSALERLLSDRGVADRNEIEVLAAAWQRAARATPHGRPVLLENDPEAGEGRRL
jgi:nitrile hydratase accessory protein